MSVVGVAGVVNDYFMYVLVNCFSANMASGGPWYGGAGRCSSFPRLLCLVLHAITRVSIPFTQPK